MHMRMNCANQAKPSPWCVVFALACAVAASPALPQVQDEQSEGVTPQITCCHNGECFPVEDIASCPRTPVEVSPAPAIDLDGEVGEGPTDSLEPARASEFELVHFIECQTLQVPGTDIYGGLCEISFVEDQTAGPAVTTWAYVAGVRNGFGPTVGAPEIGQVYLAAIVPDAVEGWPLVVDGQLVSLEVAQ